MFLTNRLIRMKIFVLMTFIYGLTACSGNLFNSEEQAAPSENTEPMHPFDVNQHSINKVVCDPMGGPGNPGPNDGLIAELYYLDSTQPHYNNVQDYFDHGTRSSQKLFFTDLNVPTRLFDTGFPTQTGGVVQNDMGEDLIEYFALRFKSVLKLAPTDMEGNYELAILSDDGTVMRFTDVDGVETLVVDNDHNHPTRMGCGDTVYFDHDTSIDVRLDYYQGPRYHISLIPMWRRVDQSTQVEPECGKKGNSRYFDFNNNSTPQQAYLDMLLRGWQPIAAENWHLPPSSIFNPCMQGTTPVISNFNVLDIGEGVAIVTWNTDIPATAQVLWTDSQGTQTLTPSDNVLRTSHQVVIDQGINFGQTYTFQGVSISADMGKALSRVLQETF